MEIKEITIRILNATPGKRLTNGEVYVYSVALGSTDSPENWTEIDESDVPKEEATWEG